MLQLDTLSSLEGRAVLQDCFREFRYSKRMNTISTLALSWRICTKEREIYRYTQSEVTVLHPLGIVSGTSLWMEEIVNRFYFSTINSFVYFGAAILLVSVGFRRIYEDLPDSIVIGSVIFEALMLMFMFIVMFFSPSDDGESELSSETTAITELVREVGEIARDYAAISVRLEIIGDTLENVSTLQETMIKSSTEAVKVATMAVNPNPQLLESMRETTVALHDFTSALRTLTTSAEMLKREEIELAVRREVEIMLAQNVINRKS
ncbi:MAG: hypothetical protein JST20_03715 [Bacteroidetes bacterium]|nr:hypothetical protein [Bacteroidota bacterium]